MAILMSMALWKVSVAMLGLATIIPLRNGVAHAPPPRQAIEAQVDAYLRPYLETANFSGAVLVARAGTVLVSKAYGQRDRSTSQPNQPNTAFHLASVSRVITSMAVMRLQEQGKLSVEDTLSAHLPDWPRGDEITIHHLLTLSAGFPDINGLPGYPSWEQSAQTPAALASQFRDLPLEFPPGTRSVHSNSNYTVLALLIERLSGMSYGDFLRKEIFEPTGMSRSRHDDPPGPASPYDARGYRPVGFAGLEPDREIHWSVKTGNGSLLATSEDLYRLDRALADATLLSRASIDAMFTEHFPSNGYGWFVGERFGSRQTYINGRSPGFGSYWGHSDAEDVTVIVLGNIYNSAPDTIGRDLMALALGQPFDPPAITTAPSDPDLLATLAGSYQFGPDFYRPNGTVSIRVQDGQLFNGTAWVMPTIDDPYTFVHRVYWSTLEFQHDASGRVAALRYDDFTGTRR